MKKYLIISIIAAIIIAIGSYCLGVLHAVRDCHVNLYETENGTMVSIQLADYEFLHFED